jgi:hypothetical protein
VHLLTAGVAYLRELVKMVEYERYVDRFIELVAKGSTFGVVQPNIDQVRAMLSSSHPATGGNPLLRIRDKVAFHWDAAPFQALIDDARNIEIELFTVDGDVELDRIFSASAHASAQLVYESSVERSTLEDLVGALVEAVAFLGHALECAFFGLIAEVGEENPRKYLLAEGGR